LQKLQKVGRPNAREIKRELYRFQGGREHKAAQHLAPKMMNELRSFFPDDDFGDSAAGAPHGGERKPNYLTYN